jgi:pyruvate dehydrogenase E2 component (dihydrolipoamide acetyltransferase)
MERDIQKVIADGYIATRAVVGTPPAIRGTGIGGRVTTFDIEARQTVSEGAVSFDAQDDDGFELVKVPNIRKIIAKAMHASLSEGAQLTLHSSFDATDVFNFRKVIKAGHGDAQPANITVTDVIVYAAARVLLSHKSMNAHFLGDKMALYNNAHIGIAVDTPRGLLVPTVLYANRLTLPELSAQVKILSGKCRHGSIEPDMLTGGTFTISNLGGLGIEMFTPILNPPQTGLLGVCCVVERTREGKPYPAIGLSLTHDHRALDGADAARFLKDMVLYLEKFSINFALEEEFI